jgi:hypothetical protein
MKELQERIEVLEKKRGRQAPQALDLRNFA